MTIRQLLWPGSVRFNSIAADKNAAVKPNNKKIRGDQVKEKEQNEQGVIGITKQAERQAVHTNHISEQDFEDSLACANPR